MGDGVLPSRSLQHRRWHVDDWGVDALVPRQLRAQELAAEAAGGPNAYAALAEAAARTPPGAEGLICLPYFAGERTPINDPDARGVYAGLTLSHTKAHLYRASLEGTAYGVRHNLETMSAMGRHRGGWWRSAAAQRIRSGCRSSPT